MKRCVLHQRGPAVVLVAAAIATGLLARTTPAGPHNEAHLPPLLPRLEFLSGIGAGYRQLLADYFWVETLQAVSAANTPEEARDIYDYANELLGLDPRFRPVYMLAGVTLPMRDKAGRWRNTRESTDILERGVAAYPDYPLLQILLAYNLSEYSHEYGRAARILEQASKLRGAPRYLPALATRLYAQAGQYDAGLTLARAIAESADDASTREAFQLRVKQIELERILRSIDAAAAAYRAKYGRPPRNIAELVQTALLTTVPQDPLGGQLYFDSGGHAQSTAEKRRLELAAQGNP